jgi:hypothetical protein
LRYFKSIKGHNYKLTLIYFTAQIDSSNQHQSLATAAADGFITQEALPGQQKSYEEKNCFGAL